MRAALLLLLCGCVLDWTPPDKGEVDADALPDELAESTDGQVDLEAPDDATTDDRLAADEVGAEDAGVEVLPPCSTEGCGAICGWSGFALGVCMASGVDCSCTEPTDCDGPFVGHGVEGRWTVYTIHVSSNSVCTVSTCSEFTGDTYLIISGGWNGENDNACGLGSEITTAVIPLENPLSVFVECLSATCSWSITVDCTPACMVEG